MTLDPLFDVRDRTKTEDFKLSAQKLLQILVDRGLCDPVTEPEKLSAPQFAKAVAATYRGSRAVEEVTTHSEAIEKHAKICTPKSTYQALQYFLQRLINDAGVKACDECGAVHQFDPYACRESDPLWTAAFTGFEGYEHRILECSCGVNHMHIFVRPRET